MEEKSQPHLMAQDAATVDPSKLTALTPEVVRGSSWMLEVLLVRLWTCRLLLHSDGVFWCVVSVENRLANVFVT